MTDTIKEKNSYGKAKKLAKKLTEKDEELTCEDHSKVEHLADRLIGINSCDSLKN